MTTAVWYCPLCQSEGSDSNVVYCPEDGAIVKPISERGGEWIGKTLQGKYKILRFLGSGGMADVFEAEKKKSGKRIALKLLRHGLSRDPDLNERFKQEAMLISLIAHPNVVDLQDFGTLEDNTHYMLMELLSGLTLAEAVDAGTVGLQTSFKVVLQACEGMAAAHERGVIHRDLKPDNIFLHQGPGGGDPLTKILDLGIGKLFSGNATSSLTHSGTIFGTPEYMSPEQCKGESVGVTSDIYSLGVVLYQLMLGRLPFHDQSFIMILTKHVTEQPVWYPEIALERGVPKEAEQVVMKALSKEPLARQESMLELQSDVASLLSRLRHGEKYALPSPEVTKSQRATIHSSETRITPLTHSNGSDREVVEIKKDVFWVGRRHGAHLECNSYLRVFRGEDHNISMLFDPGPLRDLDTVTSKVSSVLGSVEKLDYIFLNHQDPDVSSNAAAIQQLNPRVHIICSEDTWRLAHFLGFDPKRFTSTESMHGSRLKFTTGHRLFFVPTPFCHYRGAVMVYDPETAILFSGDLFGGTTTSRDMVATEESIFGVEVFHQIYMPSRRALTKALFEVSRLVPPLEIIAPQHGALVTGSRIADFIEHLGNLKIGVDLIESNERDPELLEVANDMVREYTRIAGKEKAKELVHRYQEDASFANIFELAPPISIIKFRIDPKLALNTLLRDAIGLAPTDLEQEVRQRLGEIYLRKSV